MANVSIDDSNASVLYFPAEAWNARSASIPCSSCTANPDALRMYNDTFHDGTFNTVPGSNNFPNTPLTASLSFNGTAVYVFCALAESSTSPDGDSDLSFFIDGILAGTFVKKAPGNNNTYDYAVSVFSTTSLSPSQHNLTIQNGHINGAKSLVLLDQIVYTAIDSTSFASTLSSSASTASNPSPSSSQGSDGDSTGSTKKSEGSIVGPAVAVPIAIILAALGLYLFFKRRRQHQNSFSSARVTTSLASEPLSFPPNSAHRPHHGPPASITAAAGAPSSLQPQRYMEAGPSENTESRQSPFSDEASPIDRTRPAYESQSFAASSGSSPNEGPMNYRTGSSSYTSSGRNGTSRLGIQQSSNGSGVPSNPSNPSSASLRSLHATDQEEISDEAPPAYSEGRKGRVSNIHRDRKVTIMNR
ncbi:hypothetical protein GYMLUDRAFT_271851 [Collybiopsis luxurians FD-317 M1]|nr:hypothetical protein GYMLUDRAFT_271851 [Collybiopsis luxurians FD-317 M1]